jgi:hypothetical protein
MKRWRQNIRKRLSKAFTIFILVHYFDLIRSTISRYKITHPWSRKICNRQRRSPQGQDKNSRINGSEQELDEPHLRGKVNGTTALPCNLILLNLVRTRTVNDGTKERIVVELFEVLLSLEVVTDLSELVRGSIGTVAGTLKLGIGTLDDGLDVTSGFTGRATVRQNDDQQRLLQTTGASGTKEQRLENLVVQAGTERSQAFKASVLGA